MIAAGIMSGTSADGINVALARLSGRGWKTRLRLLAHAEYPFPRKVRETILSVMNAEARVADLARLNFLLGELYADAVLRTEKQFGLRSELIGCHGQTIYHQGEPAAYLGHRLAVTWQTGEGAVVAARCAVPVVSDFRPADMVAGGKGAPLVPFLDYLLYRHARRGRVVQNLGGIGNLTAIPAGAGPEQVAACDTGPANMVIDAVTQQLFHRAMDRDGRIAARGRPMEKVVAEILRQPFFRRHPPRTAGREEFGREFVSRFLRRCAQAKPEDVVATATLLTARSIGQAVRMVAPEGNHRDFIVSGGGAHNQTLLQMIAREVEPLGLRVVPSDTFGLPSAAKEAVAFALLAYQTWHREPSNVLSATGAKQAAVLGKLSYPPLAPGH